MGVDTLHSIWRSEVLQQVADLSEALTLVHDALWVGQQAFLPNCWKLATTNFLVTDTVSEALTRRV